MSSYRSSRIVATQARKEATSWGASPSGMETSRIAASDQRVIRRLLIGSTIQRGSLRLGANAART